VNIDAGRLTRNAGAVFHQAGHRFDLLIDRDEQNRVKGPTKPFRLETPAARGRTSSV
jgi:hypothetical protein